jgi:hypothetical protein
VIFPRRIDVIDEGGESPRSRCVPEEILEVQPGRIRSSAWSSSAFPCASCIRMLHLEMEFSDRAVGASAQFCCRDAVATCQTMGLDREGASRRSRKVKRKGGVFYVCDARFRLFAEQDPFREAGEVLADDQTCWNFLVQLFLVLSSPVTDLVVGCSPMQFSLRCRKRRQRSRPAHCLTIRSLPFRATCRRVCLEPANPRFET